MFLFLFNVIGVIAEFIIYIYCSKFRQDKRSGPQKFGLKIAQYVIYTVLIMIPPYLFYPNETAGVPLVIGAIFFLVLSHRG